MNPEAWEVILFRVRSSWGLGVTKPPLNLKVLADHTKLGRVRSSHRRPRPPFPFSFCSVPPLLTQFLGSGRCPEGETGQAKTALGTPDGNRGRCGPDSPRPRPRVGRQWSEGRMAFHWMRRNHWLNQRARVKKAILCLAA